MQKIVLSDTPFTNCTEDLTPMWYTQFWIKDLTAPLVNWVKRAAKDAESVSPDFPSEELFTAGVVLDALCMELDIKAEDFIRAYAAHLAKNVMRKQQEEPPQISPLECLYDDAKGISMPWQDALSDFTDGLAAAYDTAMDACNADWCVDCEADSSWLAVSRLDCFADAFNRLCESFGYTRDEALGELCEYDFDAELPEGERFAQELREEFSVIAEADGEVGYNGRLDPRDPYYTDISDDVAYLFEEPFWDFIKKGKPYEHRVVDSVEFRELLEKAYPNMQSQRMLDIIARVEEERAVRRKREALVAKMRKDEDNEEDD